LFKEIEKDVKDMLMEGEEILFVARQARIKPGGSLFTPNAVYATNRRVIFRNPKLLGLKKNYVDVDYRDISNIRMKKGLFSTEIYLKSRFLSDEIKLPAIDKKDANQLMQIIRKGIEGLLPGQIISEIKTAPAIQRVVYPPPPPTKPTINCPTCGNPVTFIPQYQRYYCYNCKQYVEVPPPPPPPPPSQEETVEVSTTQCPKCGKPIQLNAKFCPYCGAKLQ